MAIIKQHFDLIKFSANIIIGLASVLFAISLAAGDLVGAALIGGVIVGLAFCLADKRLIASIWMIGVPTLFVFANNILNVLPFVTVSRLLFILLFGLLLLERGFKITEARPLNALEKSIAAYLFWMLLNFMWAIPSKTMAVFRLDLSFFVQGMLMPLVTYCIARRIAWRELDVERFLVALIMVGVFLFVTGALQYFLGIKWFVPTYIEVIHQGRATGTFGNAAEYCNVLVVTLIITILISVRKKDVVLKILLLVCMGLIIIGILISLTRGPIVALAVAVLFLFFADKRVQPLFLTGLILTVIIGTILAIFFLDTKALVDRFSELGPIYNRLALWATAVNMALHNPIAGVEFGRYAFAMEKTHYYFSFGSVPAIYAKNVGVPHMEYLHILIQSGVIGLYLLINLLSKAWRMLGDIRYRHGVSTLCGQLAIYASAILITYLVNGLFVDVGFNDYFPILMFFILGIVTSLDDQGQAKLKAIEV